MQIYLKKLSLTNFKGTRQLTVDFNEKETFVFGANESGKTTLMDAFLWLLFGKDSSDRKNFEIKTLDSNNQAYSKLDHVVEAVISLDGQEISIRRQFNEKWVQKRGSALTEFNGHETSYYWNDVPLKQSEFDQKIAGIMPENLFKLLTNVTYFNSLDWKERRAMLQQIAGTVTREQVLDIISTADNKPQIAAIIKAFNDKKTIGEFRAQIANQKKRLRDELDALPARIQEASRAIPEPLDYEGIENEIIDLREHVSRIDNMLMNKSAAAKQYQDKISGLHTKKGALSRKIQEVEFAIRQNLLEGKQERERNINNQQSELSTKNSTVQYLDREIANINSSLANLQTKREGRIAEWHKVNNETLQFNDSEFCCPACKTPFPADKVESKKAELANNFNSNKAQRLSAITSEGQQLKQQIDDLNVQLKNKTDESFMLKQDVIAIQSRIEELNIQHRRLCADEDALLTQALSESNEISLLRAEISEIDLEINAPQQVEDNSGLIQRKSQLQSSIDELSKKLAMRETAEKQSARVQELSDQEQTVAAELADLEAIEYTIQQYEKTEMTELENRVNGRFSMVKFKLFEKQINGGETPACVTLINGVPYADANTASKIQAGLDIINVLSSHYGIIAPVWVDNRESVTRLPETACQLINLVVSAEDKTLRIVSAPEMAEVA